MSKTNPPADVRLSPSDRPETRRDDARAAERARFLATAGWGEASAAPLAGDASTRSYERLTKGDRRALLMNAPPAAESAACPPGASVEERRRLGYNATARLAGPNLNAFTAVAAALRAAGLSAPEVYAADAAHGFALIEDLGDGLFARAIPTGADELTLYAAAIDVLVALRAAAPNPPAGPGYTMLTYDAAALEAEALLLLDWYLPYRLGAAASNQMQADYLGLWAPLLDAVGAPQGIVLRDYHAENLLWLPDRQGAARVGLIDFQDGLVGRYPYDLVSLLEDARRDVSANLAEAMIARYVEKAGLDAGGADDFRRGYAILGAQRNAKILGIFARLIRRDGKPRYAEFFPRVEAHFRRDLAHPDLAPVASFVRRHLTDLLA